jgi:hypothetical protein
MVCEPALRLLFESIGLFAEKQPIVLIVIITPRITTTYYSMAAHLLGWWLVPRP